MDQLDLWKQHHSTCVCDSRGGLAAGPLLFSCAHLLTRNATTPDTSSVSPTLSIGVRSSTTLLYSSLPRISDTNGVAIYQGAAVQHATNLMSDTVCSKGISHSLSTRQRGAYCLPRVMYCCCNAVINSLPTQLTRMLSGAHSHAALRVN